ncbi:MAG: ThuA domain-containing protein [Treponema sp.]|nr:ThuA domain-containing protein [Treponema sp.]
MKRKALILCGGWEGHEPERISGRFKNFLESEDFSVTVSDRVAVLSEAGLLLEQDLFIPVWTGYNEKLPEGFFNPLLEAAAAGLGIAGCHGGMCAAFPGCTAWQFLTGGTWIAHPGDDNVQYRVTITDHSDIITAGIEDFDLSSEQYYLHVDPANKVLATCRFPTVPGHHAANGEVDMPQVWTRKWGKGRVFYNALGHRNNIFDIPQAWEIMQRGLLWAAK